MQDQLPSKVVVSRLVINMKVNDSVFLLSTTSHAKFGFVFYYISFVLVAMNLSALKHLQILYNAITFLVYHDYPVKTQCRFIDNCVVYRLC